MAATNVPLGDITTDEKGAMYIAALERKLIAMSVNEMRYRALLEMLTGEQWEEINTDINKGELMKVATTATQRRMARSLAEAEKIVNENIAAANENAVEKESS